MEMMAGMRRRGEGFAGGRDTNRHFSRREHMRCGQYVGLRVIGVARSTITLLRVKLGNAPALASVYLHVGLNETIRCRKRHPRI